MKTHLRLTVSLLILLGLSFQAEAKNLYTSEKPVNTIGISANGINEILAKRPKIIPRPRRGALKEFLRGFTRQEFPVNNSVKFQLDTFTLRHIVHSHHPDYWDGSKEQYQTFFKRNMERNDIMKAIRGVINENREVLDRAGRTNRKCQVTATIDGISYVLGVKPGGLIGQFFPKDENYRLTNPCR